MWEQVLACSPKESERNRRASGTQSMYVEAWVNHRAVKNTIVDFRATHNFMTKIEVKHLNIFWHRDTRKTRVINLTYLPA